MKMADSMCQTCLSKDRRLIPHHNTSALFHEMNIWEMKDTKGGICWECHSMLLRFVRFKAQIKHAQRSIIYMVQDAKPFSHLSSVTKSYYDYQFFYNKDPLTNIAKKGVIKKETVKNNVLVEKVTRNKNFDQNSDVKADIIEIPVDTYIHLYKDDDLQFDDEIGEQGNLTDDEKPIIDESIQICNETVYTEPIQQKFKRKLKKEFRKNVKKKSLKKKFKIKEPKSDEVEVREKFSRVVFSEEELVKNREEKRNHPNFKKIPFKCDSCVLGFTRKETYDVHMEKKHTEKIGQYICDVCQIRFPDKRGIERHCRKHFVCYRCRLCKYETVERWSALNHCRAKHSADKRDSIHCTQCTVVVRTAEDLAEHIRSEHRLYCSECGEKFKGKHTLRTHLARIHGANRQFICDTCNRAFATKTRLESHMVSHDAALARRLAYCDACRVQYASVHVYRSHLRNSASHAERAYPCPECNKKFASKIYWTKHYNFYHLQKSEFNCGICNKLFISDWRLKNHNQKHHGLSRERDHSCNICGKKFYTQSTLRGHQLTHSPQRRFLCSDCGDTFRQRPALYTHARLVHGGTAV